MTDSSSSCSAPGLPGGAARGNTMVLVEEVADGGWGISGTVLTLAMLDEAAPADTGNA